MAYLVRKINKRDKLDDLLSVTDVANMDADIATTELKTTNGDLSTWVIDSLDSLDEAVLAMVVTSTSISKMDFMIINTKILDDNSLAYNQTDPGLIVPVHDLQDKHYDIQGISIAKLVNCINVYKQVVEDNEKADDAYIVRYVEGDIKDLLNRAYSHERIDMTILNNGIKKGISIAS